MTQAGPKPSHVRLAIGILFFVAAVGALPFEFLNLARALEGPGYGSPEVRNALIAFGAGGAALGAGFCLLIWEFTVRMRHR